MAPLLKTEKLTHIYSVDTPFEHVAIENIDFEAERGEYLGIIGQTGSGKSTFIQHLNGLLKPTSGTVFYDGRDIHESKELTRGVRFKVGLVFQYPEYQLFEETVYKDIAFGPKNMRLDEKEIDGRVREAAGFVGLGDEVLQKSPFELSGGQKRRAAIAGVIAMRPEVLILDEPTAGLDPKGRDEIILNIRQYQRSTNSTVIMVTHSMEDIARTVDRLLVFNKGAILMHGTPAQVFSKSGELTAVGLTVPKVTLVANRLRALGLPVPGDIYTIEQLKSVLTALRGGREHA
ncbi:energy-coupling factor transport system ATP-binding protein [Sporobacter termitidis DSM 10068]|uniref:Energy-coupling factor transporter ATP-binding protein EcfA2 n=1 Tax=Sporobacter termitidis DSM 10068 TaxID=1123282 RepID=A0A1M5ZEV5_9FIRM|nr:energy-coupling factor transporter ATPase [Sporobacter termitidis]SHI22770.1 energy-coupling factor transport system ATP-binding protein [Sporobacter termitidis DSM 10068]